MSSYEENTARSTDRDIRIPIDLHHGVARFFDLLQVQIMQRASERATMSAVRAEDIVDAASVILSDATTHLETALRRVDSEDVRRKAS